MFANREIMKEEKLIVVNSKTLIALLDKVVGKYFNKSNATDVPPIFGVEVLCELTGFSKSKVYKMTARNEIPCCRVGRKLLFRSSNIEGFLLKNRNVTIDEYCEKEQDRLAESKSRLNNK